MENNIEPSQSVDELISKTESFSFTDTRIPLTASTNPNLTCNLTVVGKILSSRNFINIVVRDIVEKAWKPSRPIQVLKVDRNTFLFSFGHEVDRQLAFNRRPWTIKGAHLVLKTWTPDLT